MCFVGDVAASKRGGLKPVLGSGRSFSNQMPYCTALASLLLLEHYWLSGGDNLDIFRTRNTR